ncbi:MAG: hypothetical protein JJE25_06115 [Bacteroidia bacterium]|nr:hypothetical protein [Bacteroidia bacterium]
MMKEYFLVIIAGLFFSQGIYSQSLYRPAESATQQPFVQMGAIDKVKEEIKNNIDSYQKKEKSKDTTGYRNAYFKGSELQLVSAYYKDTATEKHVEWYFQNGQFIFSVQLWIDKKNNDTLDYQRYYLANERLIAWLKFDKPVDRNSVIFKKLNYRMRDYIGELKDDNKK